MNESITVATSHFSPVASLVAIGVKVKQLDLFGPIRTQVQIKQKTVKHTPTEKLYDALISLLAGAHGLVEIKTRLRADLALQPPLGARHVRSSRWSRKPWIHVRSSRWSRKPWIHALRRISPSCNTRWIRSTNSTVKAIGTTTGQFPDIGCRYELDALQPLVQAAEATLHLTKAKRERTIIRVDAGGGTLDDLNWLLSRGYEIMAKEYAARRVLRLAIFAQCSALRSAVVGRMGPSPMGY
jgi:hypothetical protein